MSITIETERMITRPLTEDDLEWLIGMRTPEAVSRYLGGPGMQNPESIAKRLAFYIDCYKELGFGTCATILKHNGEMMGTSGLQPLEDTGEVEVGYAFSEKYWRQGFGYEIAFAWLKHGFETLGLDRIVAVAHPDNKGSWRIMEKCGMSYERTAEHYGQECVFYGITREKFLDPHGDAGRISIRLG